MNGLNSVKQSYDEGLISKTSYIDFMWSEHQNLFDYVDFLKDNDVKEIKITKDGITMLVNDMWLSVDRDDSRFIPIEVLNFKSISPYEREHIYKILENCEVAFDIGANIGWHTIDFAKRCKTVYAFEPIPHSYNYLKKHIQINDIWNVYFYNFGFSDKPGLAEFYWQKKEGISASMQNIREVDTAEKVTCSLETVDNFAKHLKVDFIKCDVEGSELAVLKGAKETLKRDKPILYVEMIRNWSAKFGYHPNDIIKYLKDLGYKCYAFVDSKYEYGKPPEDAVPETLSEVFEVTEETNEKNFFFYYGGLHE